MRDQTGWAERRPSAEQWFALEHEKIEERMNRFLPRWDDQDPEHIAKRTLLPEDGVTEWALDNRSGAVVAAGQGSARGTGSVPRQL